MGQPKFVFTPLSARVTAIVGVTLLLVFVLPWFVPVSSSAIISDSQAVGFNNRIAMVGLALGCLALAYLAIRSRRDGDCTGTDPFVLVTSVAPEDRVSRKLFWVILCLTLGMVVGVASITRTVPFSHAGYFVDVVLRVAAGGQPFSEIGFMYGPAMLYVPLTLGNALGSLGVDFYWAYYVSVAVSHLIGLSLGVYVLNRLRMSRRLRNECFALLGIYGLLQFDLGLNYTSLRYLVAYAALMWALTQVATASNVALRLSAPAMAVIVAATVSPEMGAGVFGALVVAFLWDVVRGSGVAKAPLLVLVATGLLLVSFWPASAVVSFAGGALNFPVLPGIPMLVFLVVMFVVAFGVGTLNRDAGDSATMMAIGLFALALVMIAPALGRADFAHFFWNGLVAIWMCVAFAELLWRRGRLAVRGIGTVFILAMAIFAAPWPGGVFQSGVASGTISQDAAIRFGELLGKPESNAQRVWQQIRATVPSDEEVLELTSLPDLAFTAPLSGTLGARLSESQHLTPLYVNPAGYVNGFEFEAAVAQLDDATTLAVPTWWYDQHGDASLPQEVPSDGLVMVVPDVALSRAWTTQLFWFPIQLNGRNEVFDPTLSFVALLRSDWRLSGRTDNYVLFEKVQQ